jgi:hypothetical protein
MASIHVYVNTDVFPTESFIPTKYFQFFFPKLKTEYLHKDLRVPVAESSREASQDLGL